VGADLMDLPGILPLEKSTKEGDRRFDLPGLGTAYVDCGRIYKMGCLNLANHSKPRLDGIDYTGKVFIRVHKNSCNRAECPICSGKWATKEAKRASARIRGYRAKFNTPIHVVISPDQEILNRMTSYKDLRREAVAICKRIGLEGGIVVIHPFRRSKDKNIQGNARYNKKWVYSPHFHIIGKGWIQSEGIFKETGWFVKNKGVRESVRKTLHYLLNHAGIQKKFHTATWFGGLSYNRLRVVKTEGERVALVKELELKLRTNVQVIIIPDEIEECLICGGELHQVTFAGSGDPLIDVEEGEHILSSSRWIEHEPFQEKGGDYCRENLAGRSV